MPEYFVEVIPEQDIVVRASSLAEAKEKARAAFLQSEVDLWITRNYSLDEFDTADALEQALEVVRPADALT